MGGERPVESVTRMRSVDGVMTPHPVKRATRATQEEQLAKVCRVIVKRRAERPVAPLSAKVVATHLRKSALRAGVKAESARVLKPPL